MSKPFKIKRIQKPARDFLIAFVVFSALFAVMSPSRHQAATVPILSLFIGSSATAAVYPDVQNARTAAAAIAGNHNKTVIGQPLSGPGMPLISTVLALVFSSIMAFNLALLRHLRRVNASSRRGAWKEG